MSSPEFIEVVVSSDGPTVIEAVSPGMAGNKGDRGGVLMTFDATTTDSDPGSGAFRFNSSTPASITYMYIDNVDMGGTNILPWIDTWDDATGAIKGHLVIQYASGAVTPSAFIVNITGAVETASGYRKVPVSYVSGTLPVATNLQVLAFTRAGDVGPNTIDSFEAYKNNLYDFPITGTTYTGERLDSVTYGSGPTAYTKTLNYTGDKITSIVLSGAIPSGIPTTKTITYTGNQITGTSYT